MALAAATIFNRAASLTAAFLRAIKSIGCNTSVLSFAIVSVSCSEDWYSSEVCWCLGFFIAIQWHCDGDIMEERTDCVHELMGKSLEGLYQVQPEASTIKAVDVGSFVAPHTSQEVSNGESFLNVQEVQDQDMQFKIQDVFDNSIKSHLF